MEPLTVQLYLDGQWHDAMELAFLRPADGHASPCTLGYLGDYVVAHLDRLGATTAAAVGATLPLDWTIRTEPQWPAFLFDLEPSGAARRFLLQRLALPARADDAATDLQLLAQCTPAPVGHLRIKSAFEGLAGPSVGFPRAEVVARDARFLEYAYEQGAAIGGATGAGGEAPKLLLTEDAGGLLHPDATLDDAQIDPIIEQVANRSKGNVTIVGMRQATRQLAGIGLQFGPNIQEQVFRTGQVGVYKGYPVVEVENFEDFAGNLVLPTNELWIVGQNCGRLTYYGQQAKVQQLARPAFYVRWETAKDAGMLLYGIGRGRLGRIVLT